MGMWNDTCRCIDENWKALKARIQASITGITVNGTTHYQTDGTGICDLGTIPGGDAIVSIEGTAVGHVQTLKTTNADGDTGYISVGQFDGTEFDVDIDETTGIPQISLDDAYKNYIANALAAIAVTYPNPYMLRIQSTTNAGTSSLNTINTNSQHIMFDANNSNRLGFSTTAQQKLVQNIIANIPDDRTFGIQLIKLDTSVEAIRSMFYLNPLYLKFDGDYLTLSDALVAKLNGIKSCVSLNELGTQEFITTDYASNAITLDTTKTTYALRKGQDYTNDIIYLFDSKATMADSVTYDNAILIPQGIETLVTEWLNINAYQMMPGTYKVYFWIISQTNDASQCFATTATDWSGTVDMNARCGVTFTIADDNTFTISEYDTGSSLVVPYASNRGTYQYIAPYPIALYQN